MPRLLITFFGLGHLPFAPGTWGSLGAVVIWIGLWWGGLCWDWPRWGVDMSLLALVMLVGAGTVAWGGWATEKFARPDPPQCVSDEVAGQWLALACLPIGSAGDLCTVVAVQFVLFRFLDITKPPPVRQLERLPAGWGILADDLAAGIIANLLGQVLFRTVWPLGR